MISAINHYIAQHNLIPDGSTIVVGFSGGPDSVFLLHLLHKLQDVHKITIIAAHLDHQWRANSAHDVAFCKQMAESLPIPFVSKTAAQLNFIPNKTGSQEDIGRQLRRYFFNEVRQEYSADLIALGHHEQDQQETFFIRLIRGATLSGLCGMKPRDGFYVRPLLQTSKAEILAYLQAHNIAYVIDPTNESPSYLRNRIRMNVLPTLQSCDERFDKNFLRTLSSLQETEEFLTDLTATTFACIAEKKDDVWLVNTKKLNALTPYLFNRVVLYWLIQEKVPFVPSAGLLDEIQRFLCNQNSKKHTLHRAWSVKKSKECVFIARQEKV